MDDLIMKRGVKLLLAAEDKLEEKLCTGKQGETSRWNPTDVEKERKYSMARKWITATRKRQGRAALLDNEVANEQDMEAKGWEQWRKLAHQGLKKMRGTMHKSQQVMRRMAMKEKIAKRHKQAVSNRGL
jgi:hypothetical protein